MTVLDPLLSDGTCLAGVILIAAVLRLWGIAHDLPYVHHPDEPKLQRISLSIFRGDLNPHFFEYPSLFLYLNAFAYVPYYFLGRLTGLFRTVADLHPADQVAVGTAYCRSPSAMLLGRLVTVVFSLGNVLLTYVAGRTLIGDSRVALLGALMMAVSPTNVSLGRLITPDTFLTFFSLSALITSTQVLVTDSAAHFVLAGVMVGLATGTKYYGALTASLPVIAVATGPGFRDSTVLYLAVAGLVSVITFVVTTPFSLLDYRGFVKDLKYQFQHYASGHPGMEGNSPRW